MKTVLLLVLLPSILIPSLNAQASQIQLNCVYKVEGQSNLLREVLKEVGSLQAHFLDGKYVIERPLYVDALGICVERAQALSVAKRKEYYVVGIDAHSLGSLINGYYYPAFYTDHKNQFKKLEVDSQHPNYLKGLLRIKAEERLFPRPLVLAKKCENEDTFSKGFIPGEMNRVNSVEQVVTDRTLQDVRRFDVYFDVAEGNQFMNRYEYFTDPDGTRFVTQQEGGPLGDNGSEYMLPSHLFSDAISKRKTFGDEHTAALIQQLRFALDTRYRTQEFESYEMVFKRLEGFSVKAGQVLPFTDGARRHNLVLNKDRLVLHTEVEYMLNHFDGETRLGTIVTLRAERVMVFDLKRHSSTVEHLFIRRVG